MKTRGISDAGMQRLARAQKTSAGNEAWDMLEQIRQYMGDTEILEEIIHGQSTSEAIDSLEYIARMHDIPLENDEDEDEENEDEEDDDGFEMESKKAGNPYDRSPSFRSREIEDDPKYDPEYDPDVEDDNPDDPEWYKKDTTDENWPSSWWKRRMVEK